MKHDAKIQNNLKMDDILSVNLCFLGRICREKTK